MVEFGKDNKIVHDSTCIMSVAASKVSLGMHTMPASDRVGYNLCHPEILDIISPETA